MISLSHEGFLFFDSGGRSFRCQGAIGSLLQFHLVAYHSMRFSGPSQVDLEDTQLYKLEMCRTSVVMGQLSSDCDARGEKAARLP